MRFGTPVGQFEAYQFYSCWSVIGCTFDFSSGSYNCISRYYKFDNSSCKYNKSYK